MLEPSEPGTGIFVPEELWNEALPMLKKSTSRGIGKDGKPKLAVPTVALRLASGQVVNHVVVDWSREVLFRWTGLRGPETTKDGLDFCSDEITGIRVSARSVLRLWGRTEWYSA
jgi:hypothetical protein